jgi:hypothetical protein
MLLRRTSGVAVVLLLFTLVGVAGAQTAAGLTGVVRDTTGAVLPGVTVEAASPALIEKVRSTTTDGQGRYNITGLRPGAYTVTFTLAGFAPYNLEGLELSAGFTGTANAELRVGGLAETVTVTGASATVDIQNVRTQQVLKADVLDALPSGQRDLTQFASLTLGATASTPGRNDVGGALGESNTGIAIHGGRGDDGRINYDGMNTNVFYGGAGGQQRVWKFNTIGVQETVIDTGGASAETETGGANVNMIPRDGGNRVSLYSALNWTTEGLASGKVPDSLIQRGSAADAKSLRKVYDYGLGIGGPIVKDRLWFYQMNRFWGGQSYGANVYFNKSPVFYRYEFDLDRPAYTDTWQRDVGGRITWQASEKHKVNTNLNWQRSCACWLLVSMGFPFAPEASISFDYGQGRGMYLSQTSWSYAATGRLLFQATGSFLIQDVAFTNELPPREGGFIFDVLTGRGWGALPGGTTQAYDKPHPGDNYTQRASMSYVTGTHQVKVGVQALQGRYDTFGDALPSGTNYIFAGGTGGVPPFPLFINQFASPFANIVRVRSQGVFAQDQWTIKRLTLNLGVRYDHFTAFAPAITVAAGPFKPEQSFAEARDLPTFNDITPRIGAAWDLFGNGRTAIKGGWGRYLAGLGGGDAKSLAPSNALNTSTLRSWFDANGDFVPQCDLRNFGANGECGGIFNPNFGRAARTTIWDPNASTGWGVREFSYQYSLAVQHELRQGFGVTVSYNRTDWRNQQAIVNNAVGVADFTRFCITAPADGRLGEVSGRQVCGLYDVNPGKLGLVDATRQRIEDIPGARGKPKEIFNGMDFMVNARYGNGGLLMGGVTIGRTVFDTCWQNDLPNVTQVGWAAATSGGNNIQTPRTSEFCNIAPAWWDGVGSQIKLQAVYPFPGGFAVSGSYKHLPGIPSTATLAATNAMVRAGSSGLPRDLSACLGATPCTALSYVQLAPSSPLNNGTVAAKLYDDRLNQVDTKLTRSFRIGQTRVQAIAELYNVFNTRPAQAILNTYGPSWLTPTALLGGRLFKIGAQIDY